MLAGHLAITVVTGAVSAGKDTVMKASQVPRATSLTTRPRGAHEIAGHTGYRRHVNIGQPEQRLWLREMLESRRFVQAAQHPRTYEVYATESTDYPSTTCLLEATAHWYDSVVSTDMFKMLRRVCLIPPDFNTWISWMDRRTDTRAADMPGRFSDSYRAIQRCLNDTDTMFIVTEDIRLAAGQLQAVATESLPALPRRLELEARLIGNTLLWDMVHNGVVDPHGKGL